MRLTRPQKLAADRARTLLESMSPRERAMIKRWVRLSMTGHRTAAIEAGAPSWFCDAVSSGAADGVRKIVGDEPLGYLLERLGIYP